MKPVTEKKVKEIAERAKNLKACYIKEIRALEDKDAKAEDTEIPRVSGIVIREGLWLLKIANKFIDRHELQLSEKDTKIVTEAQTFFDDLLETHSDEVRKNDFIYRLPAQFVPHLQKTAAMILKFDAEVKARIAKIEADDADDDEAIQDEIDAEMTA